MWVVRVLVIRRRLAISRRPKGRRAPSLEILSVRLPHDSAPCLRGELRELRLLPPFPTKVTRREKRSSGFATMPVG